MHTVWEHALMFGCVQTTCHIRKPINNNNIKKKIKEAVWVQTVQVEIGSNGQRWRKQSCSYIKNPWLSKLTKKELVLKTHSDSYLGLNLTVASTHTSICKILLDTSMNTEISSRKCREKCINGFMWDQE